MNTHSNWKKRRFSRLASTRLQRPLPFSIWWQ